MDKEIAFPVLKVRKVPKDAKSDGSPWGTVLAQAIYPAFRLCEQMLALDGRTTTVAVPMNGTSGYVVLAWNGIGNLDGQRIGLQFRDAGSGWIDFHLSLVRRAGSERRQDCYHRAPLNTADVDLAAKVLHACAYGMGLASAMEEAPKVFASRLSKVDPKPKRLS